MAIAVDRCRQTTQTTGTGTITFDAGAEPGYRTFASAIEPAAASNGYFYYVIEDANGEDWESGIGRVWETAGTLERTIVSSSTNSDDPISLTAGTHTVYSAPLSIGHDGEAVQIMTGGAAIGEYSEPIAWDSARTANNYSYDGPIWSSSAPTNFVVPTGAKGAHISAKVVAEFTDGTPPANLALQCDFGNTWSLADSSFYLPVINGWVGGGNIHYYALPGTYTFIPAFRQIGGIWPNAGSGILTDSSWLRVIVDY